MSHNKVTNFLILCSFIFSANLVAMQKNKNKVKRYNFEDLEKIAKNIESREIKYIYSKKIKYVKGLIKDEYKN